MSISPEIWSAAPRLALGTERQRRKSTWLIPGASNAPDAARSFDTITAGYSALADYKFGTDAAPVGAIKLGDSTALAAIFDYYASNLASPTSTINIENQRYVDFSHGENYVFASDALELTPTLPNGNPLGVSSTIIVGGVSNSRTVTVTDASAISVGQVVSLGPNQISNQRVTASIGIRGAVAGDTATLTVDLSAIGQANVVLTQTADGSSTPLSMATTFVALINADPTCQSLGIEGIKGVMPGTYWVNYPRYNNPTGPAFGATAHGSLQWVTLTPTKSYGSSLTQAHQRAMTVTLTWVTAKSGNTLTLNHRVTVANGATFNMMPSRVFERTDNYGAASTTLINVGDTTGLTVGQALPFGSNDTNLRYITAINAGVSITINAAVHVTEGILIVSQPIWMQPVNAITSASNILKFAAVPAGVRVGQQVIAYNTNPNSNLKITAINRTATPQTVTLDGTISTTSSQIMLFHEPIQSGQIWTKIGYAPGELDRNYIALELECDLPDNAAIAAWPAFWLFRNPNDVTGLAVPANSSNEIDMTDTFNYWNNLSTNTYRPQTATPSTEITRDTASHNGTYQLGNNVGLKRRKIQVIWSVDKAYFYIDGVFTIARNYVFNNSARAQIAVNLAYGSTSTSYNSSGFFPLDYSQFGQKFRLVRMRILSAASR